MGASSGRTICGWPPRLVSPQGSGGLADEEIEDQQAADGGVAKARDPVLRMQAQAVAFEQADHRQRQQDDQRQGACLDEAGADGGEQRLGAELGGDSGGHGGQGNHQQRMEPQHEADHDDQHAQQRPEVDGGLHRWMSPAGPPRSGQTVRRTVGSRGRLRLIQAVPAARLVIVVGRHVA
ncbi:hypothetical protein QE393_000531 [Pseudomonas sp. SORGH_AS 211]|nr:hypothetical protein [Pseudomonas sp. SORGH_AS_0211]